MMTASMWLNFCRCHGKYLLRYGMDPKHKHADRTAANRPRPTPAENQSFTETCGLVCDLIECFRMVTYHSITECHVNATERHINRTLELYHRLAPESHHNMIVHLLKHVPLYMRHWGPVRCYWNFDLERFFAFANRAMKQRQHPDATLIQEWRSTFLTSTDADNTILQQFVLPGENFYVDKLVMPDIKHATPYEIEIDALEATLYRSDDVFYSLKQHYTSYCKHERTVNKQRPKPYGEWLSNNQQQLTHKDTGVMAEQQWLLYTEPFNCIGSKYLKPVTFKGVKYSCSEWETSSSRKGTVSSWFRIWGSFFRGDEYYTEAWYYGRINYFVSIELNLQTTLHLASVCIYRPDSPDSLSHEPIFSTAESHLVKSAKYIYVEHIDAPIALAPVLKVNSSERRPNVFFALLINAPLLYDFDLN